MKPSIFNWLCGGPLVLIALAFAWACWDIWRQNHRTPPALTETERALDPELVPAVTDAAAEAAEAHFQATLHLLAARYATDDDYVLR